MPSMRSTIAGHEPMPYNDVMLGREKKEREGRNFKSKITRSTT
jgi:hypothetical protein